jgi:YcxB-like protein
MILLMFPVLMTVLDFQAGTLSPVRVAVILVVGAVLASLLLAFSVWGWSRAYAQSPLLREPLEGSIAQDRFVVHGASGRTDMAWDRFVRVRQGKGVILLYQGPNVFNMLAREFFESEADWDSARRLTASVTTNNSQATS